MLCASSAIQVNCDDKTPAGKANFEQPTGILYILTDQRIKYVPYKVSESKLELIDSPKK